MNRNDLLTSTRNIFLRAFLDAMRDSLSRSIVDLFKRADFSNSPAEQRLLLDARGLLQDKHDELLVTLHKFMEQLLNRSFQTTYSTFRPSFSTAEQTNSLSLVDAATYEEELRINDMTKQFRSDAEESLRDLNIRVAILFEQDKINERENPFRPYLLSRCIALSIESLDKQHDICQLLIETLGEHLSAFMPQVYGSVNTFLAQHGIAATLQYKIEKAGKKQNKGQSGHDYEEGHQRQHPQEYDSGSHGSYAGEHGKPRNKIEQLISNVRDSLSERGSAGSYLENFSTSWLTGTQQVADMLRNFFSGTRMTEYADAPSVQADSNAQYPASHHAEGAASDIPLHITSSGLAQAIQQLQGNFIPRPQAGMASPGESQNLILAHRAGLNKLTQDIDEQMTIDIVAMLFEFILRDPQVPAEVRAQLGRLQFLVLKVALRDVTLLTQKNHPARVLVNRIGSISLGLQQLDPHSSSLTAEICRIVDALLEDETGDKNLFAKLLDDLDAFIANELRTKDNKVDRAVKAVEQAENYTLRFAHTMAQMREALSGLTIDSFLREFLENTWVRAIEKVERQELSNAQAYRQVVPDLLWSIIPKVSPDERSILFKLLPEILNTLRSGLGTINWGANRQQHLLNWLMEAHTSVLRVTTLDKDAPSLTEIRQHFKRFLSANQIEDIAEHRDTTSEHLFLNEVIKESSDEVAVIETNNELDAIAETGILPTVIADNGDAEISYAEIEQRLRSGIGLEVNLSGKPSVGRLNWVSKTLSLMVLKLDGHTLPSMISVKTLSRMLMHGRARFLESEPLFERAVISLLKSAEKIDGKIPEELSAA